MPQLPRKWRITLTTGESFEDKMSPQVESHGSDLSAHTPWCRSRKFLYILPGSCYHLYPKTTNTYTRYHPYLHRLTNPISCTGGWWCWSFLAPPLGSFAVSLQVTPVSCSPEPSLSHQSVGKWSRQWAQALYGSPHALGSRTGTVCQASLALFI